MKAKSTNKFLSVALALFMLLMSVPFSMFATTASAEEAAGVYVLDTTKDLTAFGAGDKKDGEIEKAGTDGFFSLIYSTKSKVDSSDKKFEDEYSGSQRVNFGGKASTEKNAIMFKTTAPATVKVWWAEGGDDNRQIVILDAEGKEVVSTNETVAKNAAAPVATLKLPAAGTYYLGGKENNNYIFKVEVKQQAAEEKYELDTTKDLKAFGAGDKKDGETEKAGTDEFFSLIYSTKSKVDSSDKTFEDGYVGSQRVNFGGKASTEKNAIMFKTTAPATVKVWWAEGGDDNRQIVILDAEGKEVVSTNETVAKNAAAPVATLKLSAAGTYYLGGKENNNYIFKVEVTQQVAETTYELDTTKDLKAFGAGDKKDGDTEKAGTDEFFSLIYSTKSKVDSSDKTFEDGYVGSQRVNFGGKAATDKNSIMFKTTGPATVKVWWAEGGDDNRQIVILDAEGKEVVSTNETVAKNAAAPVATLKLSAAGTYYLGGKENNNYIFRVTVTTGGGEVVRGEWAKVEKPVIASAVDNGEGNMVVTVNADVSDNGGDAVAVTMFDKDGTEIQTVRSTAPKTSHELTFTPDASGTYTFKATLSREEEEDKTSDEVKADFVLPLGTPTISSATSKGNGTVEVIWGEVDEATEYEVFVNGTSNGTTKDTTYMVEGLEVGKEYSITVAAKRDTETGAQSKAATVTTTQEAQMTWGYTMYGASVGDASYDSDGKPTGGNGYLGDLNKDGQVTVFSLGGKGKVVPTGLDGVSYYYTAVPSDQNFTLKAKFHVDNWTYSNGQDGFGLLAIDKLAPYKTQYWTNQYMLAVSKMEYWWDTEANKLDTNKLATSTKYTNVLGVGVNTKLGVTKDNVDELNSDATAAAKYGIAPGTQYPLDFTAAKKGLDAGSYNIVGGVTNKDAMDKAGINALAETTDFVLELRKNNTGYFLTYYAADGKTIIGQQKFYDPKALSMVDEENVYVGFFAARNAQVTVSNVEFKTVDPKDDDPAEERPIEKIEPTVTVGSSTSVANSDKYTLLIKSNVAGTAEVKLAGKAIATGLILSGENEYTEQVVTIAAGTNKIEVIFTPDKEQELPEFTELSSTDPITTTLNVKYETYFANQKNLYVSPKGTKGGNGGKEYPLDIYTAIKVAQPGQTIILMEGTYELTSQVLIERGIDGTADNMINMIADPEAKTRPVLDFMGTKSGMKVGGSYWYFQGFDVTNAGQKTPGMVISGNNNVVDNVNAYDNTDTGIFIKALKDSNDPKDYWPSNNLILNCTSHNNADAGMEDADGFACKLTSGAGNVFDGCIAYNNADDGWDLYAKTSTGEIGAVTIKNCVAYSNGILEDGTNAGNGNGFKMGGENLPGGHKIINSVSFNNKANGITCNSCPDISIENCTVFNNGSANVTVYSTAANTNFSIKGLISFRTEKTDIDDSLKPNGTQKVEDLYADDNYFWLGGKSVNKSGVEVTKDMFESLEFKGAIARNADNTINMEGFLALTETAPQDAGARMSGTPSKVFTVTADSELPPPTGFEVTLIVVVIAISAAVAIVLFRKRKSSK